MKRLTILLLMFFAIAPLVYSQSTHDILLGGGFDIVKTDNNQLFDKAQLGLDANYFVVRHFAVGAGAEIWTTQKSSFVMGMRWYGNDNVFVRFRGLIGANDASIGAGWSKPVNKDWRFEAIGDFYFTGTFALRAGVAYVIGN